MASVELPQEILDARLAPYGVSDVERLSGGASSLTYQAMRGGERVVVKVAPAGVAPVRNRDVLRQARVMHALADTAVRLPEVLFDDAGDPPDAPPLFAMTMVDGSSIEPLFDGTGLGSAWDPTVPIRMRSAALVMRTLHDVDAVSVGLGDEPLVSLVDEVERWCRLLETVDPMLAPGWEDVAERLRATCPVASRPSIVHGDFRLGNLLSDGPSVNAIIDWEIWSIGDPRVDLGWFLINCDPSTYGRVPCKPDDVASRSELLDAYGRVADVDWFCALACFKSVATWSLIVKHNRRREHPDAGHEAMAGTLARLLRRAEEYLEAD